MIIGCDPGLTGALVVVDAATGALLSVTDMPTKLKRVNGADRLVLDEDGVGDWFLGHKDLGARRLVIERVGGLPGQSAPRAFTFGYGYGVLLSTARVLGFEVVQVMPQEWKGKMIWGWSRADKIKKRSLTAATKLFGGNTHWKRQKDHGRAEAALIALYGVKHVWRQA